ncbi:S1 family peptidase [Streptomyces sp. NPDC020965]|uniref:S1 family peptidase n=1 Tax=Streptomyces sp. NPDC020965 TaxID=3365105 RepID=UPI0037AC92BF
MKIKRLLPLSSISGRAKLVAVAASMVTAAALAAPTASAEPAPAQATAAQLASASSAVLSSDIGGTSWYTDKAKGKVVITADSTVSAAEINKIKKAAGSQAGKLEIKRTAGKFAVMIAGGEAIYGGGSRCSLGFNVTNGAANYALTAGHCTRLGSPWSPVGNVAATSFPVNDFGVLHHSNPAAADGRVYLYNGTYRDITGQGTPFVGQRIERSGSTTGYRTGTVLSTSATVNYGGGVLVYDTIQTNACAQPGDSGGPLFAGNAALGLLSGGSGNCSVGGITFYQKSAEPNGIYGFWYL